MKESMISETTGKEYYPSDCVRIVNTVQIAAYLNAGVELVDIYASRDYETKKLMLVAVFDRAASYDAYNKWCNHEL